MKKQILLTWDSVNHGFLVTAKAINSLQSKPHNIKINEIVYLLNQDLSKSNLAEINVFYDKKKYTQIVSDLKKDNVQEHVLQRVKESKRIKEEVLLEMPLPILNRERVLVKNVTDYQSIYNEVRRVVKKCYKENIDFHINVSPGTPQMHVVWLMLNTGGFLPKGTTLWSSQYNKKTEKTILEKISFKPNAFLSEVLEKKYGGKFIPEINVDETKSDERKKTEERLKDFSHIPFAPILLLGERGTGKSTYVRTIVKETRKIKDEAYAELACGTFTNELMRSELFGYKKGAFTGADKDKLGVLSKFKEGGLLFLDEVQDLSKDLQRQLIQVLQTHEYYPLGATESEKANFTLITASNLDYGVLISKLDLDFVDRISRFIVEVPPLRKCMEDIKSYWNIVWREVANYEDAPNEIWNSELDKYIKGLELQGNFRDLQKIASYVIVFYYKERSQKFAIKKAIEEFEKWKYKDTKRGNYFKKNSTYNEIIAGFNKDLAEWAIEEYGSKRGAENVLERTVSMLNKDLKKERLKNKKGK